MYEILNYLLDHIYIDLGAKLHIVGILMGTNCTLLIADLFLFCYERVLWLLLLMIIELKKFKNLIQHLHV